MENFEKVMLLFDLGKEIDNIKEQFPEADEHTLALVRIFILEKMKELNYHG